MESLCACRSGSCRDVKGPASAQTKIKHVKSLAGCGIVGVQWDGGPEMGGKDSL